MPTHEPIHTTPQSYDLIAFVPDRLSLGTDYSFDNALTNTTISTLPTNTTFDRAERYRIFQHCLNKYPTLTVADLFNLAIQLLDELPHFADTDPIAQSVLTLYDMSNRPCPPPEA